MPVFLSVSAMPSPRLVVTGASGFVGRRLVALADAPHAVLPLSRGDWAQGIETADFTGAVVIHLAARAHRGGSAAEFHRDNVDKTRALAEAAAHGRARRLVFLSSIKVNGEATTSRAFTAHDVPAPEDDYGRSKRDAEAALAQVAATTGLETVIVRCPLVYGAPAKGHLATLLRVCDSGLPLPFASVRNRRSFIALDDLCRVLLLCARAESAAGKTYLVAHRDAVSTPQLIGAVRDAFGRPARLFAMPPRFLELMAAAAGMGATMERLTRSLEADASFAENELGWRAQTGLEEAIAQMAGNYRA
jgi:nucleoside-diphosphate-sugar epimerase